MKAVSEVQKCLQHLTLRSHGPTLAAATTVGLRALTVSSQVDRERPHPLQSHQPASALLIDRCWRIFPCRC